MNKGCYYCKFYSNNLSGYCDNIENIRVYSKELYNPINGKPRSTDCSKFNSTLECEKFEQVSIKNPLFLWVYRNYGWISCFIYPTFIVSLIFLFGVMVGKMR